MKKHILFLFAAALALVGCSNEDLTGEQPAKGKQVTLSATVDMGVDVTTRATTDDITASTVNFKWEDGDKVVLVDASNQNSSVFTIIGNSISSDGKSAQFKGLALNNMESYHVVYAGRDENELHLKTNAEKVVKGEAVTLPYTYTRYNFVFTNTKPSDGTLQCTETSFTLYGNNPHIRVQLVGDATLGKVYYSLGTEALDNAKTTIDFGKDGFQLSKSDATELIIPALSPSASGFTLYFCDTDGEVIKTKKANIDLAANKGKIVNFGELEVKDPNLLPGRFSVSATKQVQFTEGNLYWNGRTFKFEANQTDYPSTRNADHVANFYWATTAEKSYATSYNGSGTAATDKLFADGSDADHMLTVKSTTDLYVLSNSEWTYLMNTRANASNLRKYPVTVDGKLCLIIAPDGFTETLKSTYNLAEINDKGLLCLPTAGISGNNGSRSEMNVSGYYWASDAKDTDNGYVLAFYTNNIYNRASGRANGESIRLVKTVETEN